MRKYYDSIEKLAIGTVAVAPITPKNISDAISDAALHEVVISQAFKPIEDFNSTGQKTVVVPNYKNYITVTSDVGENTSISPSSFSYDGTTVNIFKVGVRIEMTNEALQSTKRNLLQDALYMGSKVYAVELDKRAETVMLGLQVATIDSWDGGTLGTVTSGLSPIITITSITGGTVDSVDYNSGKVLLTGSISAGTLTYTYSENRTVKNSSGMGSLKIADILDLKGTMNANTMYPDLMYVNPIDMTNFVKDTLNSLFSYMMIPQNGKQMTGNIGRILDMNVISSGLIPQGAVILVDTEKLGYNLVTRPLTGKEEKKPEIDSVWYHLWSDVGYGVYDTLSVGLIVNLKTGQYPAASIP